MTQNLKWLIKSMQIPNFLFKLKAAVGAFSLLIAASCESKPSCNQDVFVCVAENTQFNMCETNDSLYISNFTLDGKTIAENTNINEYVKQSYHRSLVNEHSLVFNVGEKSVLLSDYESEKFNNPISELTIQIESNPNKQVIECKDNSLSKLAGIENNSSN